VTGASTIVKRSKQFQLASVASIRTHRGTPDRRLVYAPRWLQRGARVDSGGTGQFVPVNAGAKSTTARDSGSSCTLGWARFNEARRRAEDTLAARDLHVVLGGYRTRSAANGPSASRHGPPVLSPLGGCSAFKTRAISATSQPSALSLQSAVLGSLTVCPPLVLAPLPD